MFTYYEKKCVFCEDLKETLGLTEPSFGLSQSNKTFACLSCIDLAIVEVIKESNMEFNIPDNWTGEKLIDLVEEDYNLKARVIYYLIHGEVLKYF